MARRAATRLIAGRVRRGRGALLRGTALQAASALVFVTQAAAQLAPGAHPTGGQVVAGTASIGQTTTQTTVNQSSPRAAIQWQNFDVGSQQTVQFNQPSASAVTLNRVVGPDPSQIAGRVIANGNIIITNPAGVMFYRGAQVNAGSLIVSAPGITNQNFMAGRMVFDQAANPGARVSNAGTITVKQAGLAALVAPRVANSGVINAQLGHVVLAGAQAATLDLYGDGLVSIDVTKEVTQVPLGRNGKPVTALVTNTGTVVADGGSVQITARAADGIVQNLVDAGGTIEADSVGIRNGSIAIQGVGGSVRITGRVAADGGLGMTGGTITARASQSVTVASGARVTANGDAGGGTVALGTTVARALAGRAAALNHTASPGTPSRTTREVVVEAGATVSADATGDGSGGTVTTLSTQSTRIDGLLTARGGPSSGGGGVIEASSGGVLTLNTAPDASAPAGKGGTIYLDPYDLVIGTGTPAQPLNNDGSSASIQASDPPATGTSYISPATLEQAAQNGAVSISLSATDNITVQQAVNLTSGASSTGGGQTGGASLSLQAGHDINVLANLTIGAAGSGDTLTLNAGHEIVIGAASGSPAVTLAADGNITMTTTGSFTGDPVGASITIHDNSVLMSNAAISLEASNRIAIGSNVQMSAGPNINVGDAEAGNTGILMQAGSDITVGNNTTLSVTATSDGYQPAIVLNAGGSVTIGTNSTFNAGNQYGYIDMYAGSSTEQSSNANAPAPNPAGIVSIGGGTQVIGANYIDLESGSSGQTILDSGSLVQAQDYGGGIYLYGGAGGIAINGTVNSGAGASVQLYADGPVQESAGGVIVAADLTGQAPSYALLGTGNQITQIAANEYESFAATAGNITVVDGIPLTVGGSAGSTGGGIQVPNGGVVTLIADQVTIGAGGLSSGDSEQTLPYSIYAPGGTLSIQPLTPGQPVELVTGTQTANTLSITRAELDNVFANTLQLGSSSAGPVSVGSGGTLDMTSVGGGNGFQELDLTSGGAISELAGTAIVINTLTANGTDVGLAAGANEITNLGASSASTGSIALLDTAPLTITGAITANGTYNTSIGLQADSLAFGAGGSLSAPLVQLYPYSPGRPIELVQTTVTPGRLSITQTMLDRITANTLLVGVSTGTSNINVGNAGDAVAVGTAFLQFSTAGAITEGSGAGLTTDFLTIAPSASVTLLGANHINNLAAQATGAIDVNNAGALTSQTLNSQTAIDVTTSAGDITVSRTIGTFDGSNNGIVAPAITLNSAGNLIFAAGGFPTSVTSTTGTLTLQASGSITQNAGSIVAGTLTGNAGSAALAQTGNSVTTLGAFTATSGGFSLVDSAPLSVGGGVSVANGQTLSLVSDSFQIGSGGSLSAPGGVVALAPYTAGTAFPLGGFVPASGITAATLRVGNASTGNITISGNFTLTNVGTLDLHSGAAISETASDSLTVGNLTLEAASASLIGPNHVGALGDFTLTGALALTNAGDLALTGTGSAPGGVTLALSGALTQPDGSLTTGALTVSGTDEALPTSIALSSLQNQIGVITAQSSGNIVVDAAGPLQVNVLSTPGNVTVTTRVGDIVVARTSDTFDGTSNGVSGAVVSLNSGGNMLFEAGSQPDNVVFAATSLALNAAGDITQDEGTITTPLLTGYAASATLTRPGNQIGNLGAFIASGDFSLSDGAPLAVTGTVAVGTGHTLSLASDSVTFGSGGALSAPGGVAAIAPLTAGDPLNLTSAPAAGTILANTLRFGSSTTGNISISGVFDLTNVGTLDLRSAGTITELSGGVLEVGTLTGQANNAALTGANQIGQLGTFTLAGTNQTSATSAFRLRDDQSVTVVGNVSAGTGSVVIDTSNVATADVTIAAPISTPGGDFVVYAGHSITVASGAGVSAPNGGITLEASYGTNPAATGAVQVNAALSGADELIGAGPGGITLAADVSGTNYVVLRGLGTSDLSFGAIQQNGGAISTGVLSARGTTVSLGGANQIGQLNTSLASTGAFALSDTQSLSVIGTVTVANGQSIAIASNGLQFGGGGLSAPAGLITLTPFTAGAGFTLGGATAAGVVTANTLQVGNAATGPVTLDGSFVLNQVGTLAVQSGSGISQPAGSISVPTLTMTAGGAVQLGGGLTVGGTLSVNADGSVSQSGGAITAATLTGSSGGQAQFGSGGTADVQMLAGFSGASGFSLNNSGALTVTGPVSALTVTLAAAGSLTLQGGQISADTASIGVSGAVNGSATLTQAGTTTIAPLTASLGSLTLSLPGTGAVTLGTLNAAAMQLTLDLGTGSATSATGTAFNVASLSVSGQNNAAVLSGTVGGTSGGPAAMIATISPTVSSNYTLNGCIIGGAMCTSMARGQSQPLPTPTPVPTPAPTPTPSPLVTTQGSTLSDDTLVDLLTPKSFLSTELGNVYSSDLFTVDLITIGIVRNPSDPDLLLPNISDQDY